MRGLIYKDITIFFRSIEKRLLVIAGTAMAFLVYKTGIYAGLIASFMLAITVAIQNIMCFSHDEKVNWRKYQIAMPISGLKVVASKYIAVICTLLICVLGCVVLNLVSSIIYQSFDFVIWGASIAAAVMVMLTWTGICLPVTYWFGFHSSQAMGLIVMIPFFYLFKYFEDNAGFSKMVTSVYSYISILGIAVMILFILSIVISTIGYEKRRST